jgi:hypothetical protein
VREIYRAIIRTIRASGPVQIAPTKTGINLLSGTSLGSLTLHRSCVNRGLVLARRVGGDQVTSVLQLSPRSFAHRVRVAAVSEVDAGLREWIREAYAVGKMAGRRPG